MAGSDVCLILYHDPAIGIDEAAAALSAHLRVERVGDVLHTQWKPGKKWPELRVRALTAVRARDGRVSWDFDLPNAVAHFPRAFEISFDDLDAVLDEMNTLIDLQCTLEDLTRGARFNTWNGNLTLPGDR